MGQELLRAAHSVLARILSHTGCLFSCLEFFTSGLGVLSVLQSLWVFPSFRSFLEVISTLK